MTHGMADPAHHGVADDRGAATAAELARVRLGEAHYTTLLVPSPDGWGVAPGDDGAAWVEAFAASLRASPSWALHAGRLRADARALGLPEPSFAAMTAAACAAVVAAGGGAAGDRAGGLWRLRLDHNGAGPGDIRAPATGSVVRGHASLLGVRERPPAHVRIGPRLRNPADPHAGTKRAAVASEFAVLRAAQRAGFDECVLLDVQGHVSEAITSALWFGRDGVVWTPDEGCAPLRSTTTALALGLAAVQGWAMREGRCDADALLRADWVVLANAVAGARVVASIEGRPMPPPPGWLVDATRALVDGGSLATAAVEALAAGAGPAWACAAVRDGFRGVDGPLP